MYDAIGVVCLFLELAECGRDAVFPEGVKLPVEVRAAGVARVATDADELSLTDLFTLLDGDAHGGEVMVTCARAIAMIDEDKVVFAHATLFHATFKGFLAYFPDDTLASGEDGITWFAGEIDGEAFISVMCGVIVVALIDACDVALLKWELVGAFVEGVPGGADHAIANIHAWCAWCVGATACEYACRQEQCAQYRSKSGCHGVV